MTATKSVLRRLAAGPPRPIGSTGFYGDSLGSDGLGIGTGAPESLPPSNLAVAFAAIKFLASNQGALPRLVREEDDLSHKPIKTEEFRFLWGRPNVKWRTSPKAWWVQMFGHFEGWANAYLWKNLYRPGLGQPPRVMGLTLIHPYRVRPYLDADDNKRFVLDGDKRRDYGTDQILHIPGMTFDGVKGIPPVEAGLLSHQHGMLLARWGRTFLRKGAAPAGAMMTDAEVDPDTRKAFEEEVRKLYGGPDNVGSIMLVEGGTKFERLTIPPEEAQYLQSRQFEREEILGFYAPGLPHHLLGWRSNTSNFGTGIEAQARHLVQHVLDNRLAVVADAITSELLPDGLVFGFQVNHLMRGDAKSQAQVAQIERQNGTLSAEEWRAQSGRPPRDFDDDYLVAKNMTRIGPDGQLLDAGNGGGTRPPAPRPLPEARCQNPECPSRADGGQGKLLARNVQLATIACPRCKSEAVYAAG